MNTNTLSIYVQYFFYIAINYYLYLYVYFSKLSNDIIKSLQNGEEENPKYDEENEYIKKRTKHFERVESSNQNINPIFYNKIAYDEYMNKENETKLEKKWKQRILLEYTPRGNVSMYYDPYKMGFKYQSDQKTISYELLNACAMKYVKMFQCRDFFMDEFHLTVKNPLIHIHYGIETPKQTLKTQKTTMQGPFIKRNVPDPSKPIVPKEPEKNKNKFLYVGKLNNTSFIPKPEYKSTILFQSALLDGIEENARVQDQRLSYKDFIKSLHLEQKHQPIEVSTIE